MNRLKAWGRSLILSITFFTRIPIPINFSVKEEDFHRGAYFMPLMGAVIGLFLWSTGEVLSEISPMLRGVLLWVLYLAITGGLHMDGLADLSDGIFSNRRGEALRAVIKDSRIGAFGVLALITVALLSVTLFSELSGKALLLGPLWSRSVAFMVMGYGVYPEGEKGLGKGFVERIGGKAAFIAVLFPALLTIILFQAATLLFFIPVVILARWIPKWMEKRFGGVTGDGIGFSIEVFQCLSYLAVYFFILGYK